MPRNSYASNNVSAYTINAGTGALTPVAGSPFAAGTNPVSVTVAPSGAFAYVANEGSNNVSSLHDQRRHRGLDAGGGRPSPAGTGPLLRHHGNILVAALEKSTTKQLSKRHRHALRLVLPRPKHKYFN